MKVGDRIELTLENLALGGEAIAHDADGMVIFVKDGIPGDRVLAQIAKRKKQFAAANIVDILEPSPLRIPPRCEYFGRCGGCKWQHLSYENQLKFKQQHVAESFAHLANLRDVPISPILGTDSPWYYRNKMEFSFGQDETGALVLGQHYPNRWDKLIDLETCYLESETAVDIFNLCRDFAKKQELTAYSGDTEQGLLRHLVVREGKHTGDIMVNVVTSGEYFPQMDRFVHYLTAGVPRITSIVQTINRRKGQSSQGQEELLVFGEPTICETINGLSFGISAKSFFQTNTRQTEHLYQIVQRMADIGENGAAVDLYCGTGSITLHLAQRARHVHGIELVEDAVRDAEKNAKRNQIENVSFHCGEAQKVFPTLELDAPELIVVDPPRPGLSPKVVKYLLNAAPRQIIYVSCNPATLARDAAMFVEGGYAVREAQPVDMFPHTYHIETVVNLMRR